MNSKLALTFATALCLLAVMGCSPGKPKTKPPVNQQLIENIGGEKFLKLTEARRILVVKVRPTPSGEIAPEGEGILLSEDAKKELVTLLSRDSSYIFDKTKRCIFIPEYALRIQGDEGIVIFLSPSCKQVRFTDNYVSGSVTLDVDPSYDKIMTIVKESQE